MILVNGSQADTVPVTDRGLQYGDGLFETLRVQAGRPRHWARHIKRLRLGCDRLGIRAPACKLLEEEGNTLCRDVDQGVLKIIVTRGSGGRGYRPPDAAQPTRILSTHPMPDYPQHYTRDGIVARLCQTRLGENPQLGGIKHLNRLEQVLARSEWDDPGIAEGLMLDTAGRVVEGTMTNLFLIGNDVVLTPDLSRCGVAGVMREIILEVAHGLGYTTRVADVSQQALADADEVFVCNSVIGIWPVRELGGRTLAPGPVTRDIVRAVEEYDD